MHCTRSFVFRVSAAFGAVMCLFLPLSALAQEAKPLLFVSNRGEKQTASMKFNVYSMKPDGTEQKNLTKSDMMEFDPTFSPDGKIILFVAVKTNEKADNVLEGGIYTMKPDGTDRKPLTEFKGFASSPLYSPDGKKIVFTSFEMDFNAPAPPKFNIHLMDADGKNKKDIGEGLVSGWSPDGKKLLFARFGEGDDFDPRLYIMDADGKNAKTLHEGKSMFGVFSPDGKKIACIAEAGGNQPDLVVMNADGSDPKQLTKTDDIEFAPQWSADGKSLYFTRFPMNLGNPQDATISIFRIDADGKNEKTLTEGKGWNALAGSALFLAFATRAQAGTIEEQAEKP